MCTGVLVRKFFGKLQSPAPFKIRAPIALKEDGQRVVKAGDVWVLLPHQWILCLYQADILESMSCKDSDLTIFWRSQKESPQMRKCPELWHSLDFAHPSQLPLPFALQGDSAPFLEHDSVHVLSMRCLLTKKSVAESQLLLTCMPKLAAVKETWEKIMECLSWSFTVLYNGRTPKKGFEGQAADGPRGKPMRRCVLWAITGDLEFFFASEFNWPYPNANEICPYCCADQKQESEKPFTDMRPTAAWRSTILSAADLAKKFKHPLLKVPGVSVLTLKLDILHLLDLGVSCYLYGNVLYSIMNGLGGTSKEANLASLNRLLVRLCDAQEVPSGKRIRPLHLSDIAKTSEEYPSLKHIKGARVRWLSPIMVELCKLYKAGKAPKHRLEAVRLL